MPDETDWSAATIAGNRRRQHEEFRALSFREKIICIEQMSAVAARLAPRPPTVPQEPTPFGDRNENRSGGMDGAGDSP